MSNSIYLMNKNIATMKINFDEGIYDILDEKHMPYQLKGRIQKVLDYSEIKTKNDDINRRIAERKNFQAMASFLSSRVLPLTRKNAKKVYQLLGFEQAQDDISKMKIAFVCKAVSLQDTFWLKKENENLRWEDVDLHQNQLNEIVAQVSLHGSSLTIEGTSANTPEICGGGAYAKAWKRENNELWLYKLGTNEEENESKIEVEVSNILKKCNVNALEYLPTESNGQFACKCKCMTNENLSILSGLDFNIYCNNNGLDFYNEILKIDADSIYKMGIVDYLISNRDRHSMNWGFYYNPDSMEIIGCHPLFDHNNAFDKELMNDKDAIYTFDKRYKMIDFAKIALRRTDFAFTEEIKPSDFLKREHYESFISKVKELQIPFINNKNKVNNIIKKLSSVREDYDDHDEPDI